VVFNRLTADTARIVGHTDVLDLYNTRIGTRADIYNNYYYVVADNIHKQLFACDLQLVPRDMTFYLLMSGNKWMFTNAPILNYNPDFVINEPSGENSVIRLAEKTLARSAALQEDVFKLAKSILRTAAGAKPEDVVVYTPGSLGIEGPDEDTDGNPFIVNE
jgi:hypothetical protein